MPVGAIVGGIGAVASAGASIYGANKAASTAKAAQAQNAAEISKTQAANDALYKPYVARGNSAGDEINGLLGLPTASQGTPGAFDADTYLKQNPDVQASYQAQLSHPGFADQFPTDEDFAQWHYTNKGAAEGRADPTFAANSNGDGAQNALNTYLNSTGYKFNLQSGSDAINSNKAVAGLLGSGANAKALTKYGQQVGSNYLSQYLSALQGQQSAGLSAASGNSSSNSNILGANVSNNDSAATAQGNADLSIGSNISNALGQVANAYAYSQGAKTGSSYSKKAG